jgi:hypothetical protein
MHSILGLPPQIEGVQGWLLGYDEDADFMFLYVVDSVYVVQLKLMQSKKLDEIGCTKHSYLFPFNSFYTPGISHS